ncbi:putative beta-glucosidase 5 [Bienertia sinuspersici]
MHPVMFGDYPNQMKQALGRRLPVLTKEESKLVKGSFDFIGVVFYNATIVKDDPFGDSGLCFRTFRNASLLDTSRVDYLNTTIGGLLDVLRNGTDVRGYFQWAFLDVFEFLGGYIYGYGLYYVDLDDPNRKRYAKLSAHWYSNFLKGERFDHNGIIQQMNNSTIKSYR